MTAWPQRHSEDIFLRKGSLELQTHGSCVVLFWLVFAWVRWVAFNRMWLEKRSNETLIPQSQESQVLLSLASLLSSSMQLHYHLNDSAWVSSSWYEHDSMMSAVPDLVPGSFLFCSTAITPVNTNLNIPRVICFYMARFFSWFQRIAVATWVLCFESVWAVLLVLCPAVLLRVFESRWFIFL